MDHSKKPKNQIDILVSVVSLLLAMPVTYFLGTYAVMGALFGVLMFVRGPSLEALEVFLYGAGGLLGICGLWLRAVVQPFINKPTRLTSLVAAFLVFGAIAALSLVMLDMRTNTHPITRIVSLSDYGIGLLALGMIAVAIALHNTFCLTHHSSGTS